MARLRWEDVAIRIYVDGVEEGLYKLNSMSYSDQIEVDSVKYQGDSTPSLTGHYTGGRGSMEFSDETGFASISDIFEKQKQAVIDRKDEGRIRIVMSAPHPKTRIRESKRFDDCVISLDTRAGENQHISHTMSFECSLVKTI